MDDYVLAWEWLIRALVWMAHAFLFIMSWTFGLPVHGIAWIVRRVWLAKIDKQIAEVKVKS